MIYGPRTYVHSFAVDRSDGMFILYAGFIILLYRCLKRICRYVRHALGEILEDAFVEMLSTHLGRRLITHLGEILQRHVCEMLITPPRFIFETHLLCGRGVRECMRGGGESCVSVSVADILGSIL